MVLTPKDLTFEQTVIKKEISADNFNHEAHLRLAYIQLLKNNIDDAMDIVSIIIINYVDHIGLREKYHHTLTLASVQIVAHFMNRSTSNNFSSFMVEWPNLLTQFKSLLLSHYSHEVLYSRKASIQYIIPDLIPFNL